MWPCCFQLSMTVALLSVLTALLLQFVCGAFAYRASNVNKRNGYEESYGRGCLFRINEDFGQPQPVYLLGKELLKPTTAGFVSMRAGEELTLSCGGSGRVLSHAHILGNNVSEATVICVSGNKVRGAGWLRGLVSLAELVCSNNPEFSAELTGRRCYKGQSVIRAGYRVGGRFLTTYESCFDEGRMEALYVTYHQDATNAEIMGKVRRPTFAHGGFFERVPVNKLYTQNKQLQTISDLVGSELASKYITKQQYLSRGHLAAKSDFVFASDQRATFYFFNSAPQFQTFNGGNWDTLEQNLRKRIATMNYNCTMYTGTFGVTQLRDRNDVLRDVYLYTDVNNNHEIPVPLYYYKVAYDSSRRLATAFVGVNNPYYTLAEIRKYLQFCHDVCSTSQFHWLNWKPDDVVQGYSFCCTLQQFRQKVPHLPYFKVDGLLV